MFSTETGFIYIIKNYFHQRQLQNLPGVSKQHNFLMAS